MDGPLYLPDVALSLQGLHCPSRWVPRASSRNLAHLGRAFLNVEEWTRKFGLFLRQPQIVEGRQVIVEGRLRFFFFVF